MDTDTRNKRGIEPLKQLLTKLLGTFWPIHNEHFTYENNILVTLAHFKMVNVKTVVNFDVEVDPNRTDTKIIVFDVPSFAWKSGMLSPNECANQTKNAAKIAAHHKLLLGYKMLFAGRVDDEKRMQARLQEIVQLECKLALFSQLKEQNRDVKAWYNKMSFAEFRNITSNRLNWTELVRLYTLPFNLSFTFNDTDLVVVKDIAYYQKMTQLLAETPTHVLYNYLGFVLLNEYSSTADSQLQAIRFEHLKTIRGFKKMQSDWKKCLVQIKGLMDWAISQLYVDHLVVPGTKEHAEEMIAHLRTAFNEIIQNEATWLDKTTRARVLEKAAATLFYVAYPEWIHDNAELDSRYGFTDKSWAQVKKGRYLESVLELNKFSQAKLYREFHKPKNTTLNWLMAPIIGNAKEDFASNSITLPAAILRLPFFDPGRPEYLNYGAVGAIIGHEITHHFDDKGSQYDKDGNLVNLWTPETKRQFEAHAQCFVQQYGEIVEETSGLKLNGINTLCDNIADNGGLREAFFAFQSLAKKRPQPLVPQMEAFTAEQMFFLSYASTFCGNIPLKDIPFRIEHDPHSLRKYRVNVPLGNFEQFAKTFNCPSGSKMNPEKKCQIW